jgi:predicted amidohydrolase YtcJ
MTTIAGMFSLFIAATSFCAEDRLRDLAVELTIVGGRIVYDGRTRP